MFINDLLKILHILAAMFLVAGGVGRQYTRAQARKTSDLKIFIEFSNLAGRFDTALVRPFSTLVILIGIILAVRQGWPLFGFLQGSPINWLFVSVLITLTIFPIIIFIFLPRGKIYEQSLKDAIAKGEITSELMASFNDPVVRLAHTWEFVSLLIIVALMVAKPF